ncbi:glycosyltransferase [Variovorax sp. YR216]|uniref:glycosyltransferase family 2 protein n=1 Tax=Variovorax sp. YR216 TaxID=1882828 RepID=UPI00089C450D|nr:glycosyltransferase [Variovorax sp. YR216]SEA15399.1 Glycosyltransferase involved in cell wall bisynthesis [Variovorax sp. YR216]
MSIAIEPLPLTALPAQPRVSIVIASYNYGRFLVECLDACVGQSRPPDEIVVIDDGSKDNTWELLSDYMARHPQVRGIRQPNGGVCAATNAGIAAATGDVVVLLDADDLPSDKRVERVLAALQRTVDGRVPGWVHHPLRRFSETHDDLGLTPHYHTPPEGWFGPQVLERSQSPVATITSGLAFRRELLEAIGPIAEDRCLVQDMQFWVAAALLSPVAWIPEPLGRYRAHGVSESFGGMLSSLPKVKLTRERIEIIDAWLRALIRRRMPAALPQWRGLDEQPGYNWLRFLEGWFAGSGRDFGLLMKVLRHPDTRTAPLQQRVYLYSSTCLPQSWFLAFSGLVFGASPLKAFIRRGLGRS